MKRTLIITTLNEEETIERLLESLLSQTIYPEEVVIVDGGSTDGTETRIKKYESKILRKKISFTYIKKKGNRSVGRNEAVKKANGDIIACTDAGCILDRNWIKEISAPFLDTTVDVVAGYYKGKGKTIFEKCLIPYVLVMPDKVNPQTFLPATRSMAFKKSVWKKVGGFDEKLSHNEDYVFARRLRSEKFNITFAKKAIVYWLPRTTIKGAFTMFYRFAYGDAEARIFRPKVLLLFARYFLGLIFFMLALLFPLFAFFLLGGLFLYVMWAIFKNYRYIDDMRGFIALPFIQFLSDIAVIWGTVNGIARIK